MVRVPDWAFETAAGQEMRGMGQDTAYHPGLYLTEPQVILMASLKVVKWVGSGTLFVLEYGDGFMHLKFTFVDF